jgi:hypothetical protein
VALAVPIVAVLTTNPKEEVADNRTLAPAQ